MKTTLKKIYTDFRGKEGDHEVAQALLRQSDWFCRVADFDPRSGDALPQSLSSVLAKVAKYSTPNIGDPIRDRLWRIAEHSRNSVDRLFRALNESPRREQALLPVHAVRELDANSFIKLSNRPGRNIREKLAGKPYVHAVRRFQSVNLPENRLLKAFATHLAELLELRRDYLGEEDNDLLPKFQSWLRSAEVQAIGSWDNLPPNNTLLSHRDYRRVWDAWRWLQTLDEDITCDFSNLEARNETMRIWTKHAQMWVDGSHHFVEMPVLFDFEKFDIRPWLSQLAFQKSRQTISRQVKGEAFLEPACIDLTSLHPCYATKGPSRSLCETFLWQQWKRDGESVDVELFDVDAAYLHHSATSISSSDLFFFKENSSEFFDRAARTFAAKLREVFKNDTLIWLVPDFLNDFKLEIARRNLNARFPDAEPLPRSVAAVFEKVDYSKIKGDGFPIVVIDTIGSKTCVTKLIARCDSKLKNCFPETSGFYWERCPPVVIADTDSESTEGKLYDLITVDDKGQWHGATRPKKPQFFDQSSLKLDPRVGQFEFCINLTESPVVGGIRLHSLQLRAGNIPLWRDQVSELSIKVKKDGRYQRFHLVSRGTTVKPIRGQAISIPVDEYFTLLSGKPFYQFPLYQGENADELGFLARLDSPAFPLRNDVVCKLNLTFEYGADEPYKLVFTALDRSLLQVRATWRKTEDVVITDAPSPQYPAPKTWVELRCMPKLESNETSDLLDWVMTAITQLDRDLFRTTGQIASDWQRDRNGAHFTYVRCNDTNNEVFVRETNFAKGFSFESFSKGDEVSFALHENAGKFTCRKIAGVKYREPVENIRKGLRFPIIQIWRDGRSIENTDCPLAFSDDMRQGIKYLAGLLQNDGIPSPVKYEILFLLACMHKDSPDECVQWIVNHVNNGSILDPQAVGFALGDVTEQWQEDARSKLVAHRTFDSLRAIAYAIWRDQHFVERFNLAELQSILIGLSAMLGNVAQCPPRSGERDRSTVPNWVRATVEPLELLLGLLRTRASSNSEIKMLLQPHQKITKDFATQIERVAEIVARSNVPIFSRVQINIQKPEGDRLTPDLLYALRLYLTGDDGANAIHITSVSESDSD